MTTSTKKLVGTILILVWLLIYALVVMSVGVRLLPHANGVITFLFYLFAGTLWALPVGLAFPWMMREPK
jgi:hypothetical protein